MFNLYAFFADLFDTTFAPPEALPTIQHEMPDVEWHNGFGTLNDFEVPASSCTDDPFKTW